MDFESVKKKADRIQPTMENVTPDPEKVSGSDIPVVDDPKTWTFDELANTGSVLNDSPQMTQTSAPDQKVAEKSAKPSESGVATAKMVVKLFEKVLNAVSEHKHGMTLEQIGAGISEKDINTASALAGESIDSGLLPKPSPLFNLIILSLFIFGYPIYRVTTYAPIKPKKTPSPERVPSPMQSTPEFSDALPDINPRTGKPYVRGKYNMGKKKRR